MEDESSCKSEYLFTGKLTPLKTESHYALKMMEEESSKTLSDATEVESEYVDIRSRISESTDSDATEEASQETISTFSTRKTESSYLFEKTTEDEPKMDDSAGDAKAEDCRPTTDVRSSYFFEMDGYGSTQASFTETDSSKPSQNKSGLTVSQPLASACRTQYEEPFSEFANNSKMAEIFEKSGTESQETTAGVEAAGDGQGAPNRQRGSQSSETETSTDESKSSSEPGSWLARDIACEQSQWHVPSKKWEWAQKAQASGDTAGTSGNDGDFIQTQTYRIGDYDFQALGRISAVLIKFFHQVSL